MRPSLAMLGALAVIAACGRGGFWDDQGLGEIGDSDTSGNAVGGGSANPSGSGASDASGGTNPSSGSGNSGTASGGGNPSSGSGNPTGGSTGSGMEICPSFGDACTGCISQQCADTWCDCADNEDCMDLFGCFGGCQDDQDCNQECMATFPNGIADVSLVSGCAGTTCSSTCDWGNSEFDECQECIFEDCADEYNACLAEKACTELWTCFNACPPLGLSCQQACFDNHGDGVAKLEEMFQCSSSECTTECSQ